MGKIKYFFVKYRFFNYYARDLLMYLCLCCIYVLINRHDGLYPSLVQTDINMPYFKNIANKLLKSDFIAFWIKPVN